MVCSMAGLMPTPIGVASRLTSKAGGIGGRKRIEQGLSRRALSRAPRFPWWPGSMGSAGRERVISADFQASDEKIVSMYARGMTVREIQGHLIEIYGLEVSPDLISTVTDAVLETVAEW